MTALWCLLAACYGVLSAEVVRRAGYRMSVEPGEAWRGACPRGHPLPPGPRGWVGPGRCRVCAASYGAAGRFVRPAGAAAGALLVLSAGIRLELAVWLLLLPFALLLGMVDAAVRRLPDVVTVPMAAGTAVLLGVAELLPGEGGTWTGALLGALALSLFYLVLFLINPDGMGFGDVKLASTAGLALGWYGWRAVFVGTFAGLLLGALNGLVLAVRRGSGRHTTLPFGPYLLLGALAGVALGAFTR